MQQDEDSRSSHHRGEDRSNRHRSRDRDRSRRDDYRSDDRYRRRDDKYGGSSSSRSGRDGHRDRYDRDRDYGSRSSRKYDSSRSRSRDRRRRSRSRSHDRRRDRTRDRSEHSRDKERTKRDLSVEIEQELQILRKLSDMKEAVIEKLKAEKLKLSAVEQTAKEKEDSEGASQIESKEKVEFAKKFNSHSMASGSSTKTEYVPEIQTEEERIEFQRKMQEKLQAHLAAEGKLYPKPKPTPAINTATGFANDGSFLEMFKKMQEQQTMDAGYMPVAMDPSTAAAPYGMMASAPTTIKVGGPSGTPNPIPVPVVGRRRGGKILKTGLVKKPKPIEESGADTPNDAWNLYLQEVKKYKNASCDADSKTRPLVK